VKLPKKQLYLQPLTALAAVLIFGGAVEGEAANDDPLALYGDEIHFDVLRDGEKVGFHRTQFRDHGETLSVDSTFEIEIDILFFTAFSYSYRSEAEWSGGKLKALSAKVDDDGEKTFVEAKYTGGNLEVQTPEGIFDTGAPLFPTNHWNAAVLQTDKVLNTITGEVSQVEISSAGKELVPTERGAVDATRFTYSGDIETEVWYDQAGRWVKMRFKGRDGSTIEYACRLCQGPEVNTAKR